MEAPGGGGGHDSEEAGAAASIESEEAGLGKSGGGLGNSLHSNWAGLAWAHLACPHTKYSNMWGLLVLGFDILPLLSQEKG